MTMRIFVPKELHPTERRVPLLPSGVAKLARLGAEIEVEQELGATLELPDSEYEQAGAKISIDRAGSRWPRPIWCCGFENRRRTKLLYSRRAAIHASFLDPFNERELILRLAAAEVTAVSMEMIPRTAVAQKMDVLSSQVEPERLCCRHYCGHPCQPDFSHADHSGRND